MFELRESFHLTRETDDTSDRMFVRNNYYTDINITYLLQPKLR